MWAIRGIEERSLEQGMIHALTKTAAYPAYCTRENDWCPAVERSLDLQDTHAP